MGKMAQSGFRLLRYVAVAGNIIFVLWVLYNGMNEGWKGTGPEIASYIGLIALLALNTLLILSEERVH